MSIEVLIPLAVLIVHTVLFFRSTNPHRVKNLFIAISLVGLSVLFFIVGLLLGLSGNSDYKIMAYVMIYSPIYLSLLSFFVYLPKRQE